MKKVLPLIVIVLLGSCAGQKAVSNIEKIVYGSGGGFTGQTSSYELSRNGQLSSIKNGEKTEISVLTNDQLKDIMTAADAIRDTKLDAPGNMNKFIEITYSKNKEGKWLWSMDYQDTPDEINSLFKKLTLLTHSKL